MAGEKVELPSEDGREGDRQSHGSAVSGEPYDGSEDIGTFSAPSPPASARSDTESAMVAAGRSFLNY